MQPPEHGYALSPPEARLPVAPQNVRTSCENKKKLIEVNSKLWDLENSKRAAEKKGEFGEKFIADARDVYKLNDERAKIKLAINNILGSNIREVKSHE